MSDATAPPRRSHVFKLSLALILLVMFAPVLSVLFASALAAAGGCTLNEAGTSSCVLFGADIGGLLNRLFVSGWYVLLTLPVGVLALLAWTVALIVSRRR